MLAINIATSLALALGVLSADVALVARSPPTTPLVTRQFSQNDTSTPWPPSNDSVVPPYTCRVREIHDCYPPPVVANQSDLPLKFKTPSSSHYWVTYRQNHATWDGGRKLSQGAYIWLANNDKDLSNHSTGFTSANDVFLGNDPPEQSKYDTAANEFYTTFGCQPDLIPDRAMCIHNPADEFMLEPGEGYYLFITTNDTFELMGMSELFEIKPNTTEPLDPQPSTPRPRNSAVTTLGVSVWLVVPASVVVGLLSVL